MDQIPPPWEGARGRTSRQVKQPHQKQSGQSKTDCRTIPVYRLSILAMTIKFQVDIIDHKVKPTFFLSKQLTAYQPPLIPFPLGPCGADCGR